jgi:hypothetical protein
MHALVPRWALRWCAPALLLLVVLVAQPAECPVGHHQLDGAPTVAAASFSAAPVVEAASVADAASVPDAAASAAEPDFRHGPICHESSAGDLLWTQSQPARATVVKTASAASAAVTSAAGPPVSGSPATSASSATAASGRAILLAIGIARS